MINPALIKKYAHFRIQVFFISYRSASRMAAQAVSLFLDGDVSFLPENAFPSQIQLLQVCDKINHTQ